MLGRILCRLGGHPEDQQFWITFCDGDEPVLIGCARCGAAVANNLKETEDKETNG